MRLAIDASNLRAGGGVTHLVELLRNVDADLLRRAGFDSVHVWAPADTLDRLEKAPWLHRERSALLDGALPARVWWQVRSARDVAARSCGALFVPGGSYGGRFRPFVTMFRNMLPFSPDARSYGVSARRVKLAVLRRVQAATFRRADGIVCLNEFARTVLERSVGTIAGRLSVIPHGVADGLRRAPRPQRRVEDCSPERPFRLLYVSTIDVYKHQDRAALAVIAARRAGLPVTLDLVGTAYAPALRRLRRVLAESDPDGRVVRYRGEAAPADLTRMYHDADAFLYASTCENMPNIVLEAMAAGLPIACSDRRPMPDVLGDAGTYFDASSIDSIRAAVTRLVGDVALRQALADRAAAAVAAHSWRRCAGDTLQFISAIVRGAAPAARATDAP